MAKKKSPVTAPNDLLTVLGIPELTPDAIRRLARETGFQRRKARGIDPHTFVSLWLAAAVQGAPSYNDLAARLETLTGVSVSRQAVAQRVDERCAGLLAAILGETLGARLPGGLARVPALTKLFQRVLIQDSTLLQLPARLFQAFSGAANAQTVSCQARLQSVFDLRAGRFVSFSIDPYSRNDQAAAPDLALRAWDLALRDRGYLSADEIRRHLTANAHCIYRHKHKLVYLDVDTHQPLDLSAILDRHGTLDREVLLNDADATKVRLVAAPVDEETANRRQQKLKKEMKGHHPSAALLHLQRWTIFITTIPAAWPPLPTCSPSTPCAGGSRISSEPGRAPCTSPTSTTSRHTSCGSS